MILSDSRILQEREKGTIIIEPWNPKNLGSNSYDCGLSKFLAIYEPEEDSIVNFDMVKRLVQNTLSPMNTAEALIQASCIILDAKRHNQVFHFDMPESGLMLYPGILYLGSTVEYTETHAHVPFIEGKSSMGRLGVDIHATAGKGDVGFCGNWTLEISVKQPVKLYPGMPVAQLIYFPVDGDVINPYNKKVGAKYSGQHGKPVDSMMWKNKF